MLVEGQFFNFFLTVAIGILAGFLFDLYRAVGDIFRIKKAGRVLGDILFWVVLTGIVFFILLAGNRGEIRFYVLLGLLLGALLYLRFLSKGSYLLIKKFFGVLQKIVSMIFAALLFLLRIICFPFALLWKLLVLPFGLLGRLFNRFWGESCKGVKNRLRGRLSSILNRFKPPPPAG